MFNLKSIKMSTYLKRYILNQYTAPNSENLLLIQTSKPNDSLSFYREILTFRLQVTTQVPGP